MIIKLISTANMTINHISSTDKRCLLQTLVAAAIQVSHMHTMFKVHCTTRTGRVLTSTFAGIFPQGQMEVWNTAKVLLNLITSRYTLHICRPLEYYEYNFKSSKCLDETINFSNNFKPIYAFKT